jgi:hypothetical protein
MVLETPPTRVKMVGIDGYITRPWNEWFTRLSAALNNTETKEFVTQASPEIKDTITYILGE